MKKNIKQIKKLLEHRDKIFEQILINQNRLIFLEAEKRAIDKKLGAISV